MKPYAKIIQCDKGLHTYAIYDERGVYIGDFIGYKLPSGIMLEENSRCAKCEVRSGKA